MKKKIIKILLTINIFFIMLYIPGMSSKALADSKDYGYREAVALPKPESADFSLHSLDEDMAIPTVADEDVSYWQQYSSKYYYEKLNSGQKKLWDYLEMWCIYYMTTDETLFGEYNYYDGNVYGTIPAFDGTSLGMTDDDVNQTILLFVYSNPQYYFLSNTNYPYASYASICIYGEFLDGTKRMETTQKFKAYLELWIEMIKENTADYDEKKRAEKMIYEAVDIVCDHTVYLLDCKFNQSAVSHVVYNETVCAGYTKVLTCLFSALGYENTFVSSTYKDYSGSELSHVWNEVEVNGTWYVVDATWADVGDLTNHYYVGTSYSSLLSMDTTDNSHNPKNFKVFYYKDLNKKGSGWWPECNNNLDSDYYFRCAKPSISATFDTYKATVTLSTPGYYSKTTAYYSDNLASRVKDIYPLTKYVSAFSQSRSIDSYLNYAGKPSSSYSTYQTGIVYTTGCFEVSFDLNGLEGTVPEAKTFFVGEEATLPEVSGVKRLGYTFKGWNTKSDGNGDLFRTGTSYDSISLVAGEKITLYADWEPNTYSIIFKANGGTSGTVTRMDGLKVGEVYTLNANKFKKKGYTFVGWNTSRDGKGASFADKEEIKNLTHTNGATITLFAQWEETKYTIAYKLNGGINDISNPTSYTMFSSAITLSEPTRKGWTFDGWYKDSSLKKEFTGIPAGSTGNKTVYAKWIPNQYNVKFNANGGRGVMQALKNCKYNKTYTLKANTFKRTGYKFMGWNTRKDGKGTSVKNQGQIKALCAKNGGTVTLYAQWKKKK